MKDMEAFLAALQMFWLLSKVGQFFFQKLLVTLLKMNIIKLRL
jgi:hypothetical protein